MTTIPSSQLAALLGDDLSPKILRLQSLEESPLDSQASVRIGADKIRIFCEARTGMEWNPLLEVELTRAGGEEWQVAHHVTLGHAADTSALLSDLEGILGSLPVRSVYPLQAVPHA